MYHRLFLDYDDVDLEWVLMDVERLVRLCPKLGKAIILQSSEGHYHVRFMRARLTWDEVVGLFFASTAHRGFVKFSIEVGSATLRLSSKGKEKHAPIYIGTYDPDRGFYYDEYTAMMLKSLPRSIRIYKD